MRTQKVTCALASGASAPIDALIFPVALSPGEVMVPAVVAGTPHAFHWCVLAGMLSLTTTAEMELAVVLVAVMRYCRHWPGAVAAPDGIAAVEYVVAGFGSVQSVVRCSFSRTSPSVAEVVSVADADAVPPLYFAVSVVTLAGSVPTAEGEANTRTKIVTEPLTGRESVFDVDSRFAGTSSTPGSKIPLPLPSTYAAEVQPEPARESARKPDANEM